ncbi:MAG: Gfo/Idh/MocA family oxidoreductase [Pseudonocardiaceae bacterium]
MPVCGPIKPGYLNPVGAEESEAVVAQCRIGFVGAGGVAARHAQTVAPLPQTRLVAVTDVDLTRSQRFADEYGGCTVPSLDRRPAQTQTGTPT